MKKYASRTATCSKCGVYGKIEYHEVPEDHPIQPMFCAKCHFRSLEANAKAIKELQSPSPDTSSGCQGSRCSAHA